MFQEFFTGVPSSVSSRTAPDRTTLVTLYGPSHMGESLWSPSRERILLRTMSLTSSVRRQMWRLW